MKGQRQQRIPPVSRKRQKFATGIAGGHARARQPLELVRRTDCKRLDLLTTGGPGGADRSARTGAACRFENVVE